MATIQNSKKGDLEDGLNKLEEKESKQKVGALRDSLLKSDAFAQVAAGSKKKADKQKYYNWSGIRVKGGNQPLQLKHETQSESEDEPVAPPAKQQKNRMAGAPFYGQEFVPPQPVQAKKEEEPTEEKASPEANQPLPNSNLQVSPSRFSDISGGGGDSGLLNRYVPKGLKDRLQQLGKEAMNDPAIKQELHKLGWTILDNVLLNPILLPFLPITLPVLNWYALGGKLWKKNNYLNPLYHMFSMTQIAVILLADLIVAAIIFLFIALVVITYCYASLNVIWDAFDSNGMCNGIGIISLLQGFGVF